MIKTQKQIKGIRRSCKLASQALDWITPFVKPGITTKKLNELLHSYIIQNNGVPATFGYKNYPASCCISVNECVCHGVPNDYVLKDGDITNIDVTVILYGYYGDTSRMYLLGQPEEKALKLVQVTKECMDLGIAQVFPGNHIGNIGFHIHQHAISHGYSVVEHFCGHGVGLKFHEEDLWVPFVAPKDTGEIMKPGMIFTVEPMINEGASQSKVQPDGWTHLTIDRKLSAQWEHTVLVTETGHEILTAS